MSHCLSYFFFLLFSCTFKEDRIELFLHGIVQIALPSLLVINARTQQDKTMQWSLVTLQTSKLLLNYKVQSNFIPTLYFIIQDKVILCNAHSWAGLIILYSEYNVQVS